MLSKSFMAEIDGTWAGADLIPFYKKHELKLSIVPLGAGRIAEYRDWSGDIVLNQSFVDEYVRANGLTPARLLSQAGALNGLTVQLSPLFVHEAWHQVQGDFARGLNAPDMVSQNWELESMQVEALYVLQKLKYDPKFKKIMEAAQDGSKPAREAISKAQRLEKGAAYYRNTIVTWHYPGVQSLEGWAGKALNDDRYFADKIRAELKRREELPVWTRMSLSGAKPFSSSHLSADQWSKELPEVGSKTLETILATYDASLAKTPQVYEAYERRLTDLNRATEARVAELKAGGGAPPKKAEPVPAPAGARK
jgi:hypothetical protein